MAPSYLLVFSHFLWLFPFRCQIRKSYVIGQTKRVWNDDEILLPQNTQNIDGMSNQSQKKQKVSFNDKWR